MRVSEIRLMFIDGAFLLFVYLHHTFADGSGMNTFLQDLAPETQHYEVMAREIELPIRSSTCQSAPQHRL